MQTLRQLVVAPRPARGTRRERVAIFRRRRGNIITLILPRKNRDAFSLCAAGLAQADGAIASRPRGLLLGVPPPTPSCARPTHACCQASPATPRRVRRWLVCRAAGRPGMGAGRAKPFPSQRGKQVFYLETPRVLGGRAAGRSWHRRGIGRSGRLGRRRRIARCGGATREGGGPIVNTVRFRSALSF